MDEKRYLELEESIPWVVDVRENGTFESPFWEDVCRTAAHAPMSYGGGINIDMSRVHVGQELLEYMKETVRREPYPEARAWGEKLIPAKADNVLAPLNLFIHSDAFSCADGTPLPEATGTLLTPHWR